MSAPSSTAPRWSRARNLAPRRQRRLLGRTGSVLDGRLPAARLWVQSHELALLLADTDSNRQAERLQVRELQRMVMRPSAGRQQACSLAGALGAEMPLEHSPRESFDLDDRFAGEVGEDQRLILVPAGT